jgi:hypothetical protein
MRKLSVIPLLALLFVGCGGGGDATAPPSPKELCQSDISNLYQASFSSSASSVNREFNNAFTKIFGGTSGYNVANYMNTRLAHVWNVDDLAKSQIYPSDLGSSKSWLDITDVEPETNSNVQTEASNNGVSFWLVGKIEGKSVMVYNGSETISINNPREGIITLGKAYAQNSVIGGRSVAIPRDYRLAIVAHEARHSDCTGGFPASYIQKARTASSFESFLTSIGTEQLQCGHLHVVCPRGHDFAGHAACDKENWGAYSVGGFYAAGTFALYPYGSMEREIMEFDVIDSFSRLLGVSNHDLSTTSPDMGSKHD